MTERLEAELGEANAELRAHRASWAYAFAMGSSCHGGSEHPVYWEVRERTDRLVRRCADLRARLAEHTSGC